MKSAKLDVEVREERGTAANRRLRLAGKIPCILYGLGRENMSLAVEAGPFSLSTDRGVHIYELELGGKTQVVMLKDLQWDALGSFVLHADFIRVDREKTVQTYIPIRTVGTAPTVSGSIVETMIDEIHVEVLPLEMPDEFLINLKSLNVGMAVTIAELDIPEGCRPLHEQTDVVVTHHLMVETEEVEEVVEGEEEGVEPEVIGAKPDEEGGD